MAISIQADRAAKLQALIQTIGPSGPSLTGLGQWGMRPSWARLTRRLACWRLRGTPRPRATMMSMRANPTWGHLGLDRDILRLVFNLSVVDR